MNNKKIILAIIILAAAAVGFYFINQNQATKPKKNSVNQQLLELKLQTNDEAGLSIEVMPVDFSFGQPIKFGISFTTHQGDLDFDLTQKAVLFDDKNNQYLPISWDGGSGGHHLSGNLIFPPLKQGIKQFKLVIKNIYNVSERIFEWNLE